MAISRFLVITRVVVTIITIVKAKVTIRLSIRIVKSVKTMLIPPLKNYSKVTNIRY